MNKNKNKNEIKDIVEMIRETDFVDTPSNFIKPLLEEEDTMRIELCCPICGERIGILLKKDIVE